MRDLIEVYKEGKENKSWLMKVCIATGIAMGIGAYMGVLAYYNGWLG